VIDECLRLHKGVLVKKALASGHLALDTRHADPVSASLSLVLGHPGVTSAVIGSINPDHLRNNVSKAREILATQQK
jgi:aryl-alcohol dehydrogenase-like predicted oxidoreductase